MAALGRLKALFGALELLDRIVRLTLVISSWVCALPEALARGGRNASNGSALGAGAAGTGLPSLLLSHPKVAVEGAESDCSAPPYPAIAANGSRARNHTNREENRYGW